MRIIRSLSAMAAWSRTLRRQGVTIGLVPTMGALHAGHRALIRRARLSCDAVVVSLFVNPRQFGPSEDLARYPRRGSADARLCRREGIDVLFLPSRARMYPPGFGTSVTVEPLSRRWEGEVRPGHFEGVATVVTKFMGVVKPDLAFFGQKDFQQAVLVRRLAEDLSLGTRIVLCPTVREADGLALSSRNALLTKAQRRAAPVLFQALQSGRAAVQAGVRSGAAVRRAMARTITSSAAAPGVRVDYLAVCDPDTLEPLQRIAGRVVLLGAVRIGRVRLIDNLLVRSPRR